MKISSFFGWFDERIKSQGTKTEGTVTKLKAVTAIKINTKTTRTSSLDGAVFPHVITFSYNIQGKNYTGKRFLDHTKTCLAVGSKITVFYDGSDPTKYAI